jgi:hypothetical protein
MAYTDNCGDCSQRDYQFRLDMAKQQIYDNMEDDSPENIAEGFPVREACLEHEDKFDLLSEMEKKKKQEKDIQVEEADRAGTRNNNEGTHYDWSWVAAQTKLPPAKPYCYLEAVLTQHAARFNKEEKNCLIVALLAGLQTALAITAIVCNCSNPEMKGF